MLRLIRRLRGQERPGAFAAPVDPGGGVVYAVGDVHGRHDLLGRILDRILDDARSSPAPARIVFLGDYIDRGEGVRETIATLRTFADRGRADDAVRDPVFLMGNHEQMLLRFLEAPPAGARWLRYGGLQTLLSYGVRGVTSLGDESEALRLRDELLERMGPDLDFIRGLDASHRAGNVFFAHAGADPRLPPEEQDVATLLWGSERFRKVDRSDGIWVVYGHFVVDRPSAERGRIAVDTGAYYSGRLTAARIVAGDVSFLQS